MHQKGQPGAPRGAPTGRKRLFKADRSAIAKRLREVINQQDQPTIAALARKTGVAPNTVGGWVSDGDKARAPDLYQLLQVARSRGLSLDWLLLGRGEMLWVEPAPEPHQQVMNALRAVITAHGDWAAEELESLHRPQISRRLFEGFLREVTELLEFGREIRRIWQDLEPELS